MGPKIINRRASSGSDRSLSLRSEVPASAVSIVFRACLAVDWRNKFRVPTQHHSGHPENCRPIGT
jgi:hypothetical protein